MRLSIDRFLKILLSTFFIQTSWSFFSMQGMGFLFNLIIGTSKEKKNQIMRTHRGFFNTHPYMASYIIGATIRAYDEQTPPEEIKKFVAVAQTSFASAGDLLFWQTIRPALLLIAVVLGIHYGIIGPLVFLVIYNILHLYHRAQGILDGYAMGWNVIYVLKARRFKMAQQIFEISGALFCGFLSALISFRVGYLLAIPLTILFAVMLLRRHPALLLLFIVLLIIIVFAVV